MSYYGPEQITQVVGLAADQVAAINVFLASGRVIPAALKDNAFSFSAPAAQFPAKIVAYDSQRHPIWINVLAGAPKPTPCPTAQLAPLRPAQPHERVDLGTLTINGRDLFGKSPNDIRSALGAPARVETHSFSNGHGEPTYYYGSTTPDQARLVVQFGWHQHRIRANSFTYNNTNVSDSRLGSILRMQPEHLQQAIRTRYGRKYKLDTPYGLVPEQGGCTAAFTTHDGVVRITFGINPWAGARPLLTLHHGY